ncbi:MAG: DUF4093 domain-containing protein [Clostridia bacterium]|nr:DUF4093 domain-containing protein [Clostridia bacterium]
MRRVRQAIVVEGKYDTIRVRSAVDALVVETNGFGIFRDKARLEMLRQLARERGLVILTDSDSAGALIRNHLLGAIPAQQIRLAYVPPRMGKERRKAAPSKEGLLGVEGIDNATVIAALERAGAIFEEEETPSADKMHLTKVDLVEAGLSGTADSADRRRRVLEKLGLPLQLSANRLLEVVNATLTPAEWQELLQELPKTAT